MLFAASGLCAGLPSANVNVAGQGRHCRGEGSAVAFLQAGAFMPYLVIDPVQQMIPGLRMGSQNNNGGESQTEDGRKPETDEGNESPKGSVEGMKDFFKSDKDRKRTGQWKMRFGRPAVRTDENYVTP